MVVHYMVEVSVSYTYVLLVLVEHVTNQHVIKLAFYPF